MELADIVEGVVVSFSAKPMHTHLTGQEVYDIYRADGKDGWSKMAKTAKNRWEHLATWINERAELEFDVTDKVRDLGGVIPRDENPQEYNGTRSDPFVANPTDEDIVAAAENFLIIDSHRRIVDSYPDPRQEKDAAEPHDPVAKNLDNPKIAESASYGQKIFTAAKGMQFGMQEHPEGAEAAPRETLVVTKEPADTITAAVDTLAQALKDLLT